ncbi:50S ribosomal protein L4 [Marinisporobacter balticus]|uniref:Large ribosomal subunit protein uL4 n=1 Tax=Marinisporobacter balticus TaxID=2018667 RepID=A0A4R2KNG2_9FIRM|nr:50S ribosomal protein L4 [Marinisporobacter balticus]TCO75014.1 large subunit ribosomal protein L4 [Marinisporobacter balticus]
MPKVDLINVSGQQVGEIELSENIFGAEINVSVLHEVVKNYLANQRQGTQSAKTRADVRGGGKKPWKQKGTGRARQGTTRAPHWVGGGVAFAPKPRSYRYALPKKVKRLAMKCALSAKVQENGFVVLDELNMTAYKTKDMVNILNNLNVEKKALIVLDEKNECIIKSASNIPGVTTTLVSTLNVYDILNHDKFIVTKDAVHKIEEVYA